MKIRAGLTLLVLGFIGTGCAHHRDVRPGASGVHSVVLSNEGGDDETARQAMSQANHFCKERYQSHALVVDEKNAYQGSMDENEYKKGKTVSKVAQMVGGAGYVFGGKNERAAGGIVGLGGGIADAAMGNAYQYKMNFKCGR